MRMDVDLAPLWRRWLLWLAATAIAVMLSVSYVDRPLAIFAQDWFGPLQTDRVEGSSFIGMLVLGVVATVLVRRAMRYRFERLDLIFLLTGTSLLVGDATKRSLKVVFGRTWPKFSHPSFLHDGVYGFNPFHVGYGYGSFPSGHMTAICALVSVLWICLPRLRPLYAACAVLLGFILVAGDYHFLSDVIAGSFLGTSVGLIVVSIWNLIVPRLSPNLGKI